MANFVGKNSISNLSSIIEKENANNVLIFCGKKSYETIKPIIENELSGVDFQYYSDFSTNPKKEEIDIAIEKLNDNFDIILAIGGGSVIDFAKAYRYYTKPLKLIAIPTTCGTGSEATQFAVIYIEGVKHSLDESSILPDYAIVDSQFVENNPKYLKACTSMDAYCQAIESYWAVKSTEESREYAKQAIQLCKENIVEYVNSNNPDVAEKMSLASNLAGKAINISRTTASHALSYKITSEYKIPHGHAVALTIAQLFEFNMTVCNNNCVDLRGVEFVKERVYELNNFISFEPCKYFHRLFEQIELAYDFNKMNVSDFNLLVSSVNTDRLGNNPVKLSEADLLNIFIGN